MPATTAELDERVRRVWKAATWLQLGKVDPALGLLETLAALPADEWSAAVLRGTRLLRAADGQSSVAADLDRAGEHERASVHWARADGFCAEARGSLSLYLTLRFGTMVLALPDPWHHVLDAFQERLDGARRVYASARPGQEAPVVVQSSRPGA